MALVAKSQGGFKIVWSLASGASGTGVPANFRPQSLGVDKSATKKKLAGAGGETEWVGWYDVEKKVTIEVIPSGTDAAGAKASAVVPEPGAEVTITDTTTAETNTATKYYLDSANLKLTPDGEARIIMEMTRYACGDLT